MLRIIPARRPENLSLWSRKWIFQLFEGEGDRPPGTISSPAWADFISLRRTMASIASSTRERPTRMPLLHIQIVSRRGDTSPAGLQHG